MKKRQTYTESLNCSFLLLQSLNAPMYNGSFHQPQLCRSKHNTKTTFKPRFYGIFFDECSRDRLTQCTTQPSHSHDTKHKIMLASIVNRVKLHQRFSPKRAHMYMMLLKFSKISCFRSSSARSLRSMCSTTLRRHRSARTSSPWRLY